MSLTTPAALKSALHDALAALPAFETCALLDYPNYLNVGDHLIGLGTLLYLTQTRGARVSYVANPKNFSEADLAARVGEGPILLQGGGNFGDIWPVNQAFRERIVERYRDRPLILLPQTLHFREQAALERVAKQFNAHPDLTLVLRDRRSYATAQQYFDGCKVLLAPDMAFQLAGLVTLPFPPRQSPLLYHCRDDRELNADFGEALAQERAWVMADWSAGRWWYRDTVPRPEAIYWRVPGLVRLVREGWQRGLATPGEWLSRQQWHRSGAIAQASQRTDGAVLRGSWDVAHSGLYQFSRYRRVVTNRLHGHILCVLAGIPHVFLPNAYFKNEAFYETWTCDIPWGRFARSAADLPTLLMDL
ncbi:polysaccharide pyruvyl transferase family protein [Geitlerinema sp. PCC 7407]|uniref:polysaccharide pyruvyl transferase family protein n=1 Tax=Geitlerinema sp. PCC 7407 TaxID=1173025 RepID=UPI00029FB828|nr:polysaccharide pyruvyl transferase family protein [Geitlerinema sp. PCC 7407]AFY67750.1 polysaccharide pyruvyl transferase [Geitlerinema sp. PCC 7407]